MLIVNAGICSILLLVTHVISVQNFAALAPILG